MQIYITNYEELLGVAGKQAEPQRLLFVFLKSSQPKNHKGKDGGELEPIMCVDKPLDELGNFSDLVTESEGMGQDWHIVLIACLSGRNGIAPSADDATQPLKKMVQAVENGGDLSRFVAFDKGGDPVQFGD